MNADALNRVLNRVRTFDALRYYHSYRFLFASSFLYSVCTWVLMIVQGWLTYELTGSAMLVAIFGAVRMAPQLSGPFAGAFVDMLNRKKVLVVLRLAQAVFISVLAVLSATGLLQYWHLVLVGFFEGIVMTVSYPAFSAITMDIVGEESLVNAVSLNMVVMNFTRVLGPAMGGALVSFLGATTCFWLVAALAFLAMLALLPMKVPVRTVVKRLSSVFQDIGEGYRYVIHNRDMVAVIAITLVANLLIWPAYSYFMPIFAKDNLQLDAFGLGILTSGFGAGALISSLGLASMGNLKRKGMVYVLGTAFYAVFFGIFVLLRSFSPALVFIFLAGLMSSGFGTMQGVLILLLSPEDMRGRSMGFLMLAIGGMSVGSLALGAAADVIGASLATAISCAVLFVSTIGIALWAPNLRRL